MTGRPLYAVLEDFGDGDTAAPVMVPGIPIVARGVAGRSRAAAAEREEAYEKGRAAGHAEMQARLDAEAARIRGEAERRIEGAKSAFGEAAAEQLSRGLQRQLEALHDSLADQLVAALGPVLEHLLTERAVAELVDEIRRLARDGAALTIELCGPVELIERVEQLCADAVRGHSDQHMPVVRTSPAGSAEVRVVQDSTVIETRIMEWVGRIMEATR